MSSSTRRSDTPEDSPERAYAFSGGRLGPLGQFGPLGPYGPLGPAGPVVWVRPIVKYGYLQSKEFVEGEWGVLGPKGPLGPLGPLAALGPLGLGPFAEPEVAILREAEYEAYLEGTSYVIGSVATEEEGIYYDGDDFEDVYQIKLYRDDTLSVVLTQYDPTLPFDLVLLDEDGAVAARSADIPGQVKFLQASLSAGLYRVGISIVDDEIRTPPAEPGYGISVIVY